MTETLVRDAAPSGPAPERRYVTNADATCRMFASDLVERLSHVRPWVPHVIFVPVIALACFVGMERQGLAQATAWVLGGVLFWTVAEYVIHRFAFHPPQWIEDDTRRICAQLGPDEAVIPALPTLRHRFYFLVHGVHHDYPNDSTRLVMPPSVSIPLALGFWGLFVLVLGTPWAHVFTAGFLTGYLMYDMTHYHVHHHRPRTRLGKVVRELHMRHHFQDDTKGFGVSAPFWDYVFGTPQRRRTI